MTEKRFTKYVPDSSYGYTHITTIIDNEKNKQTGNIDEIVDMLNELHEENKKLKQVNEMLQMDFAITERNLMEENEQLKQDNTNLRRTMSKERVRYLQFRDKVFDLINAKIKHYEHKPFSAPVGQPMSVNFDADVDRIARLSELQDLKKELQE